MKIIRTNGGNFQADYSNQISDRFKIEAGYKGNINSRGDDVYTLEVRIWKI